LESAQEFTRVDVERVSEADHVAQGWSQCRPAMYSSLLPAVTTALVVESAQTAPSTTACFDRMRFFCALDPIWAQLTSGTDDLPVQSGPPTRRA
jgi:hypothetical protein